MTTPATPPSEAASGTNAADAARRELEQFAYIVSHDLQAPLRTQMSFVQLLRMEFGDQLQGDGAEYLRFIEESAQTMQRLIQGLLAYSRAGRIEVDKTAVPLTEVLQNAMASLRALCEARDAQVHLVDLPTIEGNREALTTVLANLLRNAIQYVPQGRSPDVHLRVAQVANDLVIDITDNGIGIPAELREAAFEVFRRVHRDRNMPDGAGVGLPVARRIARCHGGDVEIVDSDTAGTCVRVRLPLRQAE